MESRNPQAFPREDYQTDDAPGQSGMSLRDYFAAKAMPVHMAALSTWDAGSQEDWHNEISRLSYATADAMLAARSAPQPKEGGE